MKIAVITAMSEEFRAVAACFTAGGVTAAGAPETVRYQVGAHQFVVVESGVGFDNAARAVEKLIHDERPDLLISTGFCGGVAPELQTGDVVVAKKIIVAGEGGFEEIPAGLSPVGLNFVALEAADGKRTVGGTFVSTAAITSKALLAAMLPDCYPTPVVEMESGAIAIIAAEQGIPLLAIRAVSDAADEELGFSLDEFCDADMRRILPYKVLLTVLRKPRIIPQLVRLSRSSRRAAENLTAALSRLFATL